MNGSFEDSELLKYAIENGMLDFDAIRNVKEMNDRQNYLSQHPYAIWQGADGYWRTYIIDESGKRVQRKRKNRKSIEDMIIGKIKEHEVVYTIEVAFNEWNDRNLELGKISPATHLRNQQTYNRHYSEFGKRELSKVEPEEFQDFLETEVCKKKLKAKSYANLKGITRGFLKRAKKNKRISFNIEEMLDDTGITPHDFDISVKEDSDEVFTEEEYPVIMQYLIDNIDIYNLGILLMFVTGCRIGEIVSLKYEDFEQLDGTYFFTVKRTETKYIKEDKTVYEVKDFPKTPAGYRKVIIPSCYQWIYKELRRINTFNEYVFEKNGKRMNTTQIRTRMRTICKKLKIKPKSPHKIRKTYGTILLDHGIDSKVITEQMGHTDIALTERFYHRNRKNLDTKKNILDSIPEFKAL